MGERLDIVIFGATGFTGKYTVKEAARLAEKKSFTWGVAGRSKETLEAVLKEFAPNAGNIPVIVANLKDHESLKSMAERAKVIVNCVGPYRFYGELVIKACIEARTHHVDVSGEPQYMERMQLEYNEAAQKAGIYVISACGFDSIPCDLGIIYTQQKFEGVVNSVETYLNFWTKGSYTGGAILHYGTWESAVYGLAHANELRSLRQKLFSTKLPEFKPKLRMRGALHRSAISEGWSVVFPGSDRSVALRSQRFLFEKYAQRPVQVQTYVTFKSFIQLLMTMVIGGIFSILTKYSCGRSLLLKHPKIFSGGLASHEGPKPETMENGHFSITCNAKGWTEKLAEPTDEYTEPPNKEIITKISGVNPGYGATCTMLMMSAITVLKEANKMPEKCGVLPPGAAFSRTSLIDELQENGMKFELVSTIEK